MKLPSLRHRKPQSQTRYMMMNTGDIPDEKAIMPQWMISPPQGMLRLMRNLEVFNAQEMRLLGRSPTAWQCKKIIADAVAEANWSIYPIDPQKPNKTKIREITEFLKYGGRQGLPSLQPYRQLIFSTVMDVLDLDAGVMVNVFGKRLPDRLVKINSRDGSTFFKETDEFGNIVQYWQYDYRGTYKPIALKPREVAYVMMNPRSDSVYGESPMESIELVLKSLAKGISTNELVFRKGGIPSGILATIGMTEDEHDKFKNWWEAKVKNKLYQRAMVNIKPTDGSASVNWIPLITSFRDLQFLENQHWFSELVYRTFKVPVGGLGAAAKAVKGELTEETRKFMHDTVKPYLTAFEEVINQQIISHMYGINEKVDCFFHYPIVDLLQEKEELEVWQMKWEVGAATINEYRKQKAQEPLLWGEFNPLAMKQILSFGQTWWYNAIDDDGFHKCTGIPKPKATQILKKMRLQQQQASPAPTTTSQKPQQQEKTEVAPQQA